MSVENLKKFALKLGQTPNFIVSETVDIMKDGNIKDAAKKMNITQMDGGVGSDEQKFGEYTYPSVQMKTEKGQFTDYIILKDTGDFRESIFIKSDQVDAKTPAMTFGATDSKWGEFIQPQDRFAKALGLTKENAIKVGGLIAPLLAQRISNFWKI